MVGKTPGNIVPNLNIGAAFRPPYMASWDKTARLWPVFANQEAMVRYVRENLPPREVEGEEGLEGWRLTCAERKRFFLAEGERCKSINNGQ